MDARQSFSEGACAIPDGSPPRTGDRSRGRKGRWVALGLIGVLAAILATAGIVATVPSLQRNQCEANLKRLGLAFLEYHEAHGHLPAPALVRNDGTPLLSWR